MTDKKELRLSKLAREFNVGISTIVDFLKRKGHAVDPNPNTKVAPELYDVLSKEYSSDINAKKESEKVNLRSLREKKETVTIEESANQQEEEEVIEKELFIKDTSTGKKAPLMAEPKRDVKEPEVKVIGKIDLDSFKPKPKPVERPAEKPAEKPIEKEVEKPVDKIEEKPVEKPIVQQEEKPVVQEAPKPVIPEIVAPKIEQVPEKPVTAKQEEKPAEVPVKLEETPEPVVINEIKTPEIELPVERTVDASQDNEVITAKAEFESDIRVVGKIDLDSINLRTRPPKKTKEQRDEERREKHHQKPHQQERKFEGGQRQGDQRPQDQRSHEQRSHDQRPQEQKSQEHRQRDQHPRQERDRQSGNDQRRHTPNTNEPARQDNQVIRAEAQRLSGPTVVGKINLPSADDRKKPVASSDVYDAKKKKRKRIRKDNEKVSVPAKDNKQTGTPQSSDNKPKFGQGNKDNRNKARRPIRQEVSEEDVQKQIKDTLARLTSKGKSKTSKYRREKRDIASHRIQEELEQTERDKNILKVTEFVSVNELASMMEVPVTAVISTCMNMGLFVSINQRLDAETMALVADEFNFKVEFISVEVQEAIKVEEDTDEDLVHRPPIVTVMGHVDHGKTKLLDYIRNANVIAGEAGGITQHIGAYAVQLEDGRKITFLDTPGHEAFTAMRARGAKITDVAIIVVAADDGVMPQTKEAINHVSAAGVPIVFAINKVDKPDANPEKIKEELANLNYLVEDWGGKYQSQEISAKSGLNIDNLLEKVLLEAELLDLKANPNKRAFGTVVESSLDRGRGYIATILVQGGTLHTGDVILAGSYFGHIKAMYNERNQKIDSAGPSMPVLILGLDGAPQAGDTFNVLEDIKEAKDIAAKREMLQREQGLRTKKHITLDEIGRRIAIGNFQELNIIVKGDVDGSVEALSDSLIKLSTQEIQVNVIHKAVGQISESDVVLATASNAIIVGFQVRPSLNARKLAEKEQIDIRFYSIIYDAIEEIRAAMEGMLSPEIKEEITGTAEIRETFKITKVGTVAGCFVKEGKLLRSSKVRIIRDGIVIHTGELGTLKRFKEDVKEVSNGYECGLNIHNFNDIKVGDFVEGFTEFEVKKKL